MTHFELRQRFLDFFKSRGHTELSAASLIPADDPSVLFTTAGMHQFKRFYLEPELAQAKKVVTIQPCFRTSDIEEVGDESHVTFLEMLGNFSFGGAYSKKEAIEFGYDFIVKELKISLDRIHVSVFRGDKEVALDDESIRVWRSLGIGDDKIRMGGREDNWWGPTGDTGPCGPSTEIYIDGIEVWNIVFNEYLRTKDGRYEKLKEPGIDTGMGLERLAMVSQKMANVFETDLFVPIIEDLLPSEMTKETRVIADHVKGSVFLLAEGILPANKDRGYVLRRLIRRAMRYGRKIGFSGWKQLIARVTELYSPIYSEFSKKQAAIMTDFESEVTRFSKLLEQGTRHLEREMKGYEASGRLTASDAVKIAELAFHMYQSFGFPPEMVLEEFETAGFAVGEFEDKFAEHFKKHQEVSRAGQEKKFGGHGLLLDTGEVKAVNTEELKKVTKLHTAMHLLQVALRQVLGDSVSQKGSDITAERLRFDFSYPKKLTSEQLTRVEKIVNQAIEDDLEVNFVELPLNEAKRTGALYLTNARYPEKVKVYFTGVNIKAAFSRELCGGPHVQRTGEIGSLKIQKEEALSAGVRRIRAVLT